MANRVRLVGPGFLGTTSSTLYTAGAGTVASILYIHVVNPTRDPQAFFLSIGVDSEGTRIFNRYVLGANTSVGFACLFVLGNNETLRGFAEKANSVSITVSGEEVSS